MAQTSTHHRFNPGKNFFSRLYSDTLRNICRIVALLVVLTASPLVHAVAIDSSLIITGTAQFDTVNSSAASGNANQSGAFSGTFNGTSSGSTINNTSVTGSNPVSGNMTETGDSLSSTLNVSGSVSDTNGGMFTDLFIDIANTSATDQFAITFAIDYTNLVDANGADAYADAQFTFFDVNTNVELFFTDLTSDTLFGDKQNGATIGSFGDALNDSGQITFELIIDPLATLNLQGLNAIEGGAYSSDASYNGTLETIISIVSVENLNGPNPVPESGSWLLLSLGLLGLIVRRRKLQA